MANSGYNPYKWSYGPLLITDFFQGPPCTFETVFGLVKGSMGAHVCTNEWVSIEGRRW